MISHEMVAEWLRDKADGYELLIPEDFCDSDAGFDPDAAHQLCVPNTHLWPEYATFYALVASYKRWLRANKPSPLWPVVPSIQEMVNAFKVFGLYRVPVVKSLRVKAEGKKKVRRPFKMMPMASRDEILLALRPGLFVGHNSKDFDFMFPGLHGKVKQGSPATWPALAKMLRYVLDGVGMDRFFDDVEAVSLGGWPKYVRYSDLAVFANKLEEQGVTGGDVGSFFHHFNMVDSNDTKKRRKKRPDGSFSNYLMRPFPPRAVVEDRLKNTELADYLM